MELSNWIIVEDYCAMRILKNSDGTKKENRIAFIEKTPRVRIEPLISVEGQSDFIADQGNWKFGPKGQGGCLGADPEIYGFYKPSRAWCDDQLREMGYILPEDKKYVYVFRKPLDLNKTFDAEKIFELIPNKNLDIRSFNVVKDRLSGKQGNNFHISDLTEFMGA